MQIGQKQVVLGKGEREERKKERKEKEKKGRKKKKEKEKKNHGGVSSASVYFKSLDFPWNFSV